MRKSFLQSLIELAGFAAVGLMAAVWFVGYNKNKLSGPTHIEESSMFYSDDETASFNDSYDNRRSRTSASERNSRTLSSRDYSSKNLRQPKSISERTSANDDWAPAGSTGERSSSKKNSKTSSSRIPVTAANAAAPEVVIPTRSWKGVHRNEPFAWHSFERFEKEIIDLSEEHGLYPQVFMARLIAYSYDFVESPGEVPVDNNLTAMKRPGTDERARFQDPLESLKAYAVVNAGEVSSLSPEGALAKHDRSWTMAQIIQRYDFIGSLGRIVGESPVYAGRMGPANKVSEEETMRREVMGEGVKMAASVDQVVREKKAKDAGYDNWEDFLEDLPEGQQEAQEKNATAVTSAIMKKKAFNLGRRVAAKKAKKEEETSKVVLNQDR